MLKYAKLDHTIKESAMEMNCDQIKDAIKHTLIGLHRSEAVDKPYNDLIAAAEKHARAAAEEKYAHEMQNILFEVAAEVFGIGSSEEIDKGEDEILKVKRERAMREDATARELRISMEHFREAIKRDKAREKRHESATA